MFTITHRRRESSTRPLLCTERDVVESAGAHYARVAVTDDACPLDSAVDEYAGDWKAPYAANRSKFVRAFYDYARANPNGQPKLWSEWLKSGAQ